MRFNQGRALAGGRPHFDQLATKRKCKEEVEGDWEQA